MTLLELKSCLKVAAGNLYIRMDDVDFKDLNSLLENLPDEMLKIHDVKIELDDVVSPKKLSIQGAMENNWEMTGLDKTSYDFKKISLIIFENEEQEFVLDFSVYGSISIGNRQFPFTGEVKEKGVFLIAPDFGTDTIVNLPEMYHFGEGNSDEPFLPGNIGALDQFLIKEFHLEVNFKEKNTNLSVVLEGKIDWPILSSPGVITVEGMIASFCVIHEMSEDQQLCTTYYGGIGGKLGLDAGGIKEYFACMLYFAPDGNWTLKIDPKSEKGFPPVKALTALAGGQELTQTVSELLQAIDINELTLTKVEIGLNVVKPSLQYVKIGSKIAIGEIEIDTTMMLPEFSLEGSLTSFDEETESLIQVDASAFLANLNIPSNDLPKLDINTITFDVEPSAKTYTLDVDMSGHWVLDDQIKLEDLKLHLGFENGGFSCGVEGTFKLFKQFEITVSAKHSGEGSGWNFSGKTKPEQEINLAELSAEILELFNVTLPIDLPEVKVRDIELNMDTGKKHMDLSFAMTDISLEKLNISGISLLDSVTVEEVALKIEADIGKSLKGYVKGELVIDQTRFEIEFDKKEEEIGFTGTVKDLSIDLKDLGARLAPGLPELVASMPVVEFSKMRIEYCSKNQAFSFTAGIKSSIIYQMNVGVLDKIEFHELQFILVANKEHQSAFLACKLQLGESADFSISVTVSDSGFCFKGQLETEMSVSLPEMTRFFLGDGADSTFALVPDNYKKILLTDLSMVIDTDKKSACFDAGTKNLGSMEFALQKSKEGNVGFVAALIPPASFPFSMLHEDLAVFDGIDLSGSCLIISSIDQPKLTLKKLTETVKDTKIVQGLNIFASMNLANTNVTLPGRGGEIAKQAKELGKVIKIDHLTIHGAIGFDLANMQLEGYIGKFSIYDSCFEVENSRLKVSVDGTFAVYGTISLNFEWLTGVPPMCFTGALKIQANGVEVSAVWTGDYGTQQLEKLVEACEDITKALPKEKMEQIVAVVSKNIMGELPEKTLSDLENAGVDALETLAQIGAVGEKVLDMLPGIQIKEVGIMLGCDWEGIPTGGCVGRFSLEGDLPENEGLVAFLFNSSNPAQSILQVKLPKDAQQTINRLLQKCAGLLTVPETIPDWSQLIELNGYELDGKWVPLQLKIVPANVMIGNTMYKKGVILQGRVVIYQFIDVILNVMMDSEAGIKAFGQMKPVVLEYKGIKVLEITRAANNVLPADYILYEQLESVSTVYDGPYFDLNIPLSISEGKGPYLKFNGRLDMLGLVASKTDCEISKDRVSFYLKEDTDVMQYDLACRITTKKELEAEGSLTFKLNFDIVLLNLSNFTLVPIQIRENFHGYISASIGVASCMITLEGSFNFKDPVTGKYIVINIPKQTYPASVLIKDLVKTIGAKVEENLKKAVSEIAGTIDYEVKQLVSEVDQIIKYIADLLADSKAVKELMSSIEEEIRKIQDAIVILKNVLAQIEAQIVSLERELESLLTQIADIENQIEKAELELAKAVEACILGATEVIILGAETTAKNVYEAAEKERNLQYLVRRTYIWPFNELPSIAEALAATTAATAFLTWEAAKIAALPVKGAREVLNQANSVLETILNRKQNLLNQIKQAQDERQKKELEKQQKQQSLEDLANQKKDNQEKENLNIQKTAEANDKKKAKEAEIENVKGNFADEVSKNFLKLEM